MVEMDKGVIDEEEGTRFDGGGLVIVERLLIKIVFVLNKFLAIML